MSEDAGEKLEDIAIEHLGTCKSLSISKDDCTILDGKIEKGTLEQRCDQIRQQMSETTSEYEKDKLKERLAKLTGGVAVIKVGGASEVEVGEVKDRLNDALCATRAAVEEGIVPGGGTALLYASKKLDGLSFDNLDRNVGKDIVKQAVRVPIMAISQNAG